MAPFAVAGGLLVAVGVESWAPPAAPPAGGAARVAHVPTAATGRPAGRAAALAARVLARPLFSPGRRPAEGNAPVAAARLPRLAGTILATGGARLAIFDEAGNGGPVVMREGQRRDGLVIVAISAGTVAAMGAQGRVTVTVAAGRRAAPQEAGDAAPLAVGASGLEMSKDPRSRAAGNQDE